MSSVHSKAASSKAASSSQHYLSGENPCSANSFLASGAQVRFVYLLYVSTCYPSLKSRQQKTSTISNESELEPCSLLVRI